MRGKECERGEVWQKSQLQLKGRRDKQDARNMRVLGCPGEGEGSDVGLEPFGDLGQLLNLLDLGLSLL